MAQLLICLLFPASGTSPYRSQSPCEEHTMVLLYLKNARMYVGKSTCTKTGAKQC